MRMAGPAEVERGAGASRSTADTASSVSMLDAPRRPTTVGWRLRRRAHRWSTVLPRKACSGLSGLAALRH